MIKLLAAILFLAATAGRAAVPDTLESPYPDDPLETTVHRLRNGLTVYLSPNREEPRVAAWIAVRAGGKHDPSDSTGMAHYLEHMLFKGTTRLGTLDHSKEKPHLDRILELYERLFKTSATEERGKIYKQIDAENISASKYSSPNEIAKAYRQMGFRGLNAFTSVEQTVYVSNFPSNRAEAWAKLEAERFAHPVFRLFQGEIETVYEEKNRSMDNAERILGEAVDRLLYKNHPYGTHTVLGSIEHLKNPSLAKMYAYYDRHYLPNNMAVALSGDFDRKEILALLERTLGSWQTKPLPAVPQWKLAVPVSTERVEVKYEAEEKVIIAWPTVGNRHLDQDALSVMDMLMDNSAAGLINLRLNQAQRVKAAGSHPDWANDAGSWHAWAVAKQGQSLEQAEALLMETVTALKAGEFDEQDISAIVTDFEVSYKKRLESNDSRVGMLVDSFVEHRPWRETVETLSRIRRVTKADVLRVAQKYLGEGRVVAYRRNAKPEIPSMVKPKFTKIDIDPSRESAFYKEVLATPAAVLEPHWLVEGRDYSTMSLPPGPLISAANPYNDLFSLTLRFELGSRQERNLCAALELLELSGAGPLTAEELKKKLYRMGTTMSVSCGEDQSYVSVSGLNANLWPSLEFMFERFEAPHTATDTLKKMAEVALGAHQDNKRNPEYIHNALEEFAKRGKESSILAELTDAEWQNLRTPELHKLIKRLLRHKRRTAYVGNRPLGEIAKLLDTGMRWFWTPKERPPLSYLKPAKQKTLFTHRDMNQSHVGIFAADEVYNPDHTVDYEFYRTTLGGGMSAIIFQEVREARSLAYASAGGYAAGPRKGDENELWGWLGCQSDKTKEAATLLGGLLQKPPFTERRFAEAAKGIEEGYRTNRVSFRGIPSALMGWQDLGFSGDPRPERFQKALRYTLDDLKTFSLRFKDRPLTLSILGNRDRVGVAELKTLGEEFEEKSLEQIFPY